MSLSEMVKDPAVQASLVADCDQLIHTHVSQKGGVSGMAFKTAYRVAKGIGPTYVQGALSRLLPDALKALDPMWEEGLQTGDPVHHLEAHRDRTADLILSVTDHRIQYSSGAIVGVYKKLRKSVKTDVAEVVPALATILGRHHMGLLQDASLGE
ncbi:MAG: hypothetical protein ACFBSG_07780 [Leptolyngbyaceae cyanobacterium]